MTNLTFKILISFVQLLENIKIGNEFSIAMEVKPRNSTGLLLSAHGKKDYMVLELMDNQVVAHVENGKGPFHAVFKLANKSSLCDGKWHKIQGETKYIRQILSSMYRWRESPSFITK